jgi:hypothetical protein
MKASCRSWRAYGAIEPVSNCPSTDLHRSAPAAYGGWRTIDSAANPNGAPGEAGAGTFWGSKTVSAMRRPKEQFPKKAAAFLSNSCGDDFVPIFRQNLKSPRHLPRAFRICSHPFKPWFRPPSHLVCPCCCAAPPCPGCSAPAWPQVPVDEQPRPAVVRPDRQGRHRWAPQRL